MASARNRVNTARVGRPPTGGAVELRRLLPLGGDRAGRDPDLTNDVGQLVDHRVDLLAELAKVVAPVDLGLDIEVPRLERTGDIDEVF